MERERDLKINFKRFFTVLRSAITNLAKDSRHAGSLFGMNRFSCTTKLPSFQSEFS